MGMIPDKVYTIVFDLLPMIVLFCVVTILIRFITCIYAKEKIIFYKEIKNLIYIIYTFALFKLISTSDFSSYSNNFILFKEIMRYNITSRLFFKNVLGNMIMFLPFGFFVSYYLKSEKLTLPLFLILIASISIEVVQLLIGRVDTGSNLW